MINIDQIEVGVRAKDSFEAISKAADLFIKKKMVRDSFTAAVIEREKKYPTGLELGVALPHAESNHVIDEGIAIITLKEPVEFLEMGNPKKKIKVSIIFLLAIKNPNFQLNCLEKIVRIIQDQDLLAKIQGAKDFQIIYNIVDRFI